MNKAKIDESIAFYKRRLLCGWNIVLKNHLEWKIAWFVKWIVFIELVPIMIETNVNLIKYFPNALQNQLVSW